MKKILSFLCCLVLALACLTACGNSGQTDQEKDDSTRGYVTLKFAIIVDERTTPEGLANMQAAFNAVTEQKYETHVEFVSYTASEYIAAMTAEMERMDASAGADDAAKEDAKADSEAGSSSVGTTTSYPSVGKNQLDLVVIPNKEVYNSFVEKGWLVSLDDQLSGTYKNTLKSVIDEVEAEIKVTVDEKEHYYAIPARGAVGEYTYLAVNKEAADLYNLTFTSVNSVTAGYELLLNMQLRENGLAYWQNRYGSDFSPILNSEAGFYYPNVRYMSKNGTDFSMIGALFSPTIRKFDVSSTITNMEPTNSGGNLMFNKDYTRYMEMVVNAKTNGYFGDGTQSNFLIGIVKGDYALRNANDGYQYYVLETPRVCDEDVFNGMLAVSSHSVNVKRSVELIQNLMTEDSLINILLYGDEENYVQDSDGVVSFLKLSNYALDRGHLVGNLEQFADPCSDYGQGADYYDGVAKHNSDLASPLFNKNFADYMAKVNEENYMDEVSAGYLERLMAATSVTEFNSRLTTIQNELQTMAADENSALFANFNWDKNGTIGWALHEWVLFENK